MGSWGGEDARQGSGRGPGGPGGSWWIKQSHICMGIIGKNNWGARQTSQSRVPAGRNKASKPLAAKMCGDCSSRKNSQPHRRVHWRGPQDPRMYTNPPTKESAPEVPNLLVSSRGSH